MPAIHLDVPAAIDRLMRFLAIEGITGEEAAIGKEIIKTLKDAGVPANAIAFDDANTRIPEPTQTGNLIVKLPGTSKKNTRPILFMTHMDTVPLCAGAKPKLQGKRIVNEATAALGGDNRTGCAVLTTLAAELIAQKLPHPPITLLYTVREESGLFGAKHLNPADLGGPAMGFNFDGRCAADVIVGAIGADRWSVDIHGRAAHAGVAPEKGISATMVFSLAMAEVFAGGWFGKVVKGGKQGTSNVGPVGTLDGKCAGQATNVVTDFVHVKGESRSHDAKFVREITAAFKTAFTNAANRVRDHEGRRAKVKFSSRLDYVPFRMKDDSPAVRRAAAAVKAIGRVPNLRTTNGGLDANWMVKHGIPTVTFGAGQNEIHTVKEFVDLVEFESGCRLAITAATA
ncbi:MAG TPA: M20/M25/M40 family metallo-hydrolase [Urbifossiella sp.]|nr:M20/M25/M40 family metallo-hydrolase [Urbifossiella sp.]